MQKSRKKSVPGDVSSPTRPTPTLSVEPTFDETISAVLGSDATDQWNVQGWFFRHRIEAKDRTEVLRRSFFDSDPRWLSAFIVMLVLAAGLATIGLSQDLRGHSDRIDDRRTPGRPHCRSRRGHCRGLAARGSKNVHHSRCRSRDGGGHRVRRRSPSAK